MKEFIPIATRFVQLPLEFVMKNGGVLHGARIAYETFGQLNVARNNVILILTGLSPDAHATANEEDASPGWWKKMLGPGMPIDTNHWYVICINSLGSCKGSTGPASLNPSTGQPYRLEFPDLAIEDIADAAAFTVRALGFEHLACVIGLSMGGMSALSFIARHPGLARNHINICGAAQALPFSIALRSLQREAIRFDPNWNHGQYNEEKYPQNGMITARKIGMLTYRSAIEWNSRFARTSSDSDTRKDKKMFVHEFEVENYLTHHAQRFLNCFDPNAYLYLSRSIDLFDLGESYDGSVDKALSQLYLENALVIGVKTDLLFPIQQQQQIAQGLSSSGTNVRFHALESLEGHDAFLVDINRFGPPITDFLSSLPCDTLRYS
ncbi:MAG TPA: homoserine O-acetyltransferase [Legionellaceae bacterium]|nr:homoserine O-acetyltransferase [Legionellaceae bacterium]